MGWSSGQNTAAQGSHFPTSSGVAWGMSACTHRACQGKVLHSFSYSEQALSLIGENLFMRLPHEITFLAGENG
jgi:hypothetical protein